VITAAHVIKNSFADSVDASDWQFLLGSDENWNTSEKKTPVSKILLHPGWVARQNQFNRFGDGDELGVDLAIVYLASPVVGVYPAQFPQPSDDPLGQRAVLAGFGTLVEGINGNANDSNQRRVGGENIFDRSVEKVFKEGVPDSHLGGLLAIDFDSSEEKHNTLGSNMPNMDLLGAGNSDTSPLPLEASTAYGDSGGPAFAHTQGAWRVHGVVSYGTKSSKYGDVTVFTRIASHHSWISENLPDWPNAKSIGYNEWRESSWWGIFVPLENKWSYHYLLGWVYVPNNQDDSFWLWHPSLGWSWFSPLAYPNFYEFTSKQWYYLSKELSMPGLIVRYNHQKQNWEHLSGS